jgi:hypothetical protein
VLLSALEWGLKDEVFFLERGDFVALLDLAPRQGEMLVAVCQLARSLNVQAGSDCARRIDAFATARRGMLEQTNGLLAGMEAELSAMRRASARLRQYRNAIVSTAEPASAQPCGWA